MKKLLLVLALGGYSVLASYPLVSQANEKVAPRQYWLRQGYQEIAANSLGARLAAGHSHSRSDGPVPAFSLSWPVAFKDAQHSLGNIMAQFQPFGSPYYHGGIDLRIAPRAAVVTQVAGILEAGHYGYTDHPDGSMTKVWKPWPQTGDSTYFEVAVTTDDGYRFEYHHVDRTSLPTSIVAKLNQGHVRIPAGTTLGNAIVWEGQDYDHIHYNIITPDGVRLNPEHFSQLLSDHVAPEVQAVFAVDNTGKVFDFGQGNFVQAPAKFVVAVIDHLDNDIYDHPPALVKVHFENGQEAGWDFREKLMAADGKFPPIWNFFVDRIKSPSGRILSTSGGYGTGLSVVQVQLPPGVRGAFTIELGDQAGNLTQIRGHISGQ